MKKAEEWDFFCVDCEKWCGAKAPSAFELRRLSYLQKHTFMVKHRLHYIVETTIEAIRRNQIERKDRPK